MIGVISKQKEGQIVKEFFELFKTPWEFYQENRSYDVVLVTADKISELRAKLVVIYGSEKRSFDFKNRIETGPQRKKPMLNFDEKNFPIYGKVLTLRVTKDPLVMVQGSLEAAGIEINVKDKKILRIGFDLFQEISTLLNSGQPAEYAHIPTLEIHISMLRNWILQSGIPLVEIPPVPEGYDFITCLTHDVDFVGIRNHIFDHTMFGFVYRALIGSFMSVIRRRGSWDQLLKNWKAVLLLPFVYLGIVDDVWNQFGRYMEMESDLGSTFFFLPFKNRTGKIGSGQAPKMRAAKYDLEELKGYIENLKARGCEIGLHGIDAWQDVEKGRKELAKIRSIASQSDIGVRIHWLYFDQQSAVTLEEAGLFYDSTLGYNDAVGYWGGTTQVFRPLGSKKLMELPLNIQDTAMFYPDRMGLRRDEAFSLCKEMVKNNITFGGVLVINWHQRSLAPERLWGDFYIGLLDHIKRQEVFFGTAKEVILWFQKRREARFERVEFTKKEVRVKITGKGKYSGPELSLRLHKPIPEDSFDSDSSLTTREFVQVPIEYNIETEISL